MQTGKDLNECLTLKIMYRYKVAYGCFFPTGNLFLMFGTFCAGKVREKFPLEMADIQGAVVAADINDDGKIELVTADTHGNVAAWTAQGQEIWEKNLKSLIPQVNHLLFLASYLLSA